MAIASPRPGLARTAGGLHAPEAMPSGLPHNIGAMAELMRNIQQMLRLGPLTPQEAGQVSDIMTRLGVMMKEMSGPRAETYQSQHQLQLQEMKAQLAEIKSRLESRRK
jgi:hypothetical protein